jgi:hypothetical protein
MTALRWISDVCRQRRREKRKNMSLETAAIEWVLARSAVLDRVTDVGARRYQSATRALIQEIGEFTAAREGIRLNTSPQSSAIRQK